MKDGYYITSDEINHPIKLDKTVYLDFKDIIKLVVPNGVKYIWCGYNKLKELIIPDGIKYLSCDDINIQDLDNFFNKDVYINLCV